MYGDILSRLPSAVQFILWLNGSLNSTIAGMTLSYKHTIYACYAGYIVQAIINNLGPLLFLTFQRQFNIPVAQISLLITVNFCTQIAVDILCAKYADVFGYRLSMETGLLFAALGLIGMSVFPSVFPTPFSGLICAIMLNAVGGGITEVLVSPIVEASPDTTAKAAAMSLLHSFYCWGHVTVVLLSTVMFRVFGMEHWNYVPLIWAAVPLLNMVYFLFVPISKTVSDEKRMPVRTLFTLPSFWLFMLIMLCAGASEQGMSQWSSYFAESGLHVSKTVGDLLGPCAFAFCMGLSRAFYGKKGSSIDLKKFMSASCILCVVSYLTAVFAPHPVLALCGCALCGLSVGIMWPGTFSLASAACPQGGTAMFAFFAFAGDAGCASGPGVVGAVSAISGSFKTGLLCAVIFPVVLLVCVNRSRRNRE